MRYTKTFLSLALIAMLTSSASAQLADGECTVFLDPAQFEDLVIDEIGVDDIADFAIAAPLMMTSPIADGVLTPGEYANACFFSYAENENPGFSHPDYDNLDDGDADLTTTLHFAHTEDALFIAFDVTDDFLDLDEGSVSFRNDGVELFINPDYDTGDAWGPGKFQIYVDAAGEGDIEFNNRGSTAGITGISFDDPEEGEFYSAGLVKEDESGYIVEFKIPLASLDTAGGDEGDPVPMQTGDIAMINTAIDDNDEDDDLGAQNGHHLLWQPDGARTPYGAGEAGWQVPLLLSDPVTAVEEGDYDGDGQFGPGDLDVHSQYVKDSDLAGDLDGNGTTDLTDRVAWIRDIQNSYVGDSNFDGQFDSSDFVAVFTEGKYETGEMASYTQGDWNGDMIFDSGDFVTAFTDGGYEEGPRTDGAAVVPEPAAASLLCLGLIALFGLRRRN